MPIVAEGRKHYTEVVAGTGSFEENRAIDYYFESVDVKGSGDVEPIGVPLVWIDADSAFAVYTGQDISAATSDGSPARAGARVAVAVGNEKGLGFNAFDVTLSATAVKMTAYVGGEAGLLESGIDFGAANATQIAAFKAEIEKQGGTFVKEAGPVATSYV